MSYTGRLGRQDSRAAAFQLADVGNSFQVAASVAYVETLQAPAAQLQYRVPVVSYAETLPTITPENVIHMERMTFQVNNSVGTFQRSISEPIYDIVNNWNSIYNLAPLSGETQWETSPGAAGYQLKDTGGTVTLATSPFNFTLSAGTNYKIFFNGVLTHTIQFSSQGAAGFWTQKYTETVRTPSLKYKYAVGVVTYTETLFAPTAKLNAHPNTVTYTETVQTPSLQRKYAVGVVTYAETLFAPSLQRKYNIGVVSYAETLQAPSLKLKYNLSTVSYTETLRTPSLPQRIPLTSYVETVRTLHLAYQVNMDHQTWTWYGTAHTPGGSNDSLGTVEVSPYSNPFYGVEPASAISIVYDYAINLDGTSQINPATPNKLFTGAEFTGGTWSQYWQDDFRVSKAGSYSNKLNTDNGLTQLAASPSNYIMATDGTEYQVEAHDGTAGNFVIIYVKNTRPPQGPTVYAETVRTPTPQYQLRPATVTYAETLHAPTVRLDAHLTTVSYTETVRTPADEEAYHVGTVSYAETVRTPTAQYNYHPGSVHYSESIGTPTVGANSQQIPLVHYSETTVAPSARLIIRGDSYIWIWSDAGGGSLGNSNFSEALDIVNAWNEAFGHGYVPTSWEALPGPTGYTLRDAPGGTVLTTSPYNYTLAFGTSYYIHLNGVDTYRVIGGLFRNSTVPYFETLQAPRIARGYNVPVTAYAETIQQVQAQIRTTVGSVAYTETVFTPTTPAGQRIPVTPYVETLFSPTVRYNSTALPAGTNEATSRSRKSRDDWDWQDTKRYWELQGVIVKSPYEAEIAQRKAEEAARKKAEEEKDEPFPHSGLVALPGLKLKFRSDGLMAHARPRVRAENYVQMPSIGVKLGELTADGSDWRDDPLMLAALDAATDWEDDSEST